jgi:uncharacterized membrane protein
MSADTVAPSGPKKRGIMSTASWIALIAGILMVCLGAVFIANAAAVTNTVADEKAVIQEMKTVNDKQDDMIQQTAQSVAAMTANVNNLMDSVKNLTSLVQGHILRERQ